MSGADRGPVLVALSGGVDSSVAAALLVESGVDVHGITMRLWGGESDTGCCSVADVDDARRVAQQLGIPHHVLTFTEAFEEHVVGPYVAAHAEGRTPNPCIECNRHLKFDLLLRRAEALGFEQVATGHHARVVTTADGIRHVARGADRAKDQSYVLAMLGPAQLARVVFPVGTRTKDEVRAEAARLGLRTANKPDSQDVCFITATGGRRAFLGDRIPLHPGRVVDADGRVLGAVPAVELVTVGQRRGLGVGIDSRPRYVVAVDPVAAEVRVGPATDLLVDEVVLDALTWTAGPVVGPVRAQVSAHGPAEPALVDAGPGDGAVVRWPEPRRRVAPGQTVALYDADTGDVVVGCGTAS